jgi:hypothetical protein
VNFTREPIIETIITPREGCKLAIRSSKGNGQEDYLVDAVEVVSFGHSFFFRSTERPKSFLVPVSDYEVLELKETRMILKNVSTERSIKIGGGREAPPRPQRDTSSESPQESREDSAASSDMRSHPQQQEGRGKRDRRRRGRRGRDRHDQQQQRPFGEDQSQHEGTPEMENAQMEESPIQEAPVEAKAPSFISKLFPPPSTLIKETLSRYKPAAESTEAPAAAPEETIFEHPTPPVEEGEDEE